MNLTVAMEVLAMMEGMVVTVVVVVMVVIIRGDGGESGYSGVASNREDYSSAGVFSGEDAGTSDDSKDGVVKMMVNVALTGDSASNTNDDDDDIKKEGTDDDAGFN